MTSPYISRITPVGNVLIRTLDGASIPSDPKNVDYQTFLAWKGAGNTPEVVNDNRPAVPVTITNYQCRTILMGMPSPDPTRSMFQLIDAAIHALGGNALQAWEYSNEITRDGAMVANMAAQFGFTSAQVDQLFISASTITA